jgi:hypothetical protein
VQGSLQLQKTVPARSGSHSLSPSHQPKPVSSNSVATHLVELCDGAPRLDTKHVRTERTRSTLDKACPAAHLIKGCDGAHVETRDGAHTIDVKHAQTKRLHEALLLRTSLKSVMVRTLKPVMRSTWSLAQRAWPNTRT